MAYVPKIVKPHDRASAKALIEARMQRQALIRALAMRLQGLIDLSAAFRPKVAAPPEQPVSARPPKQHPVDVSGPWRPGATAVNPASGPLRPPFTETASPVSGPFRPRKPDYLPSWPPPSAYDWVRMPGFYDEQPPAPGANRF